jgi:signal transduction histidine kinase
VPTPRSRSDRPRRLRLPRRTARLRLTVMYSSAFLACGAAVLALAYLLFRQATHPAAHISSSNPLASSGISGTISGSKLTNAIQQATNEALNAGSTQIAFDRQVLLIASAIALGVFAVVAAVIGWVLAGRVLQPLSTITAAARRISASSLHERLALHGPDDELKELADTLDGLFARLESSFDAQRRFAANASHALRTPLTRERTLLQVTLADPASTTDTWQAISRQLLASNAEQERLIEALLTLASSEAGIDEHEPTDLAAIAGAVLAAAGPAISQRGLRVQADLEPAAIAGDPLLIQQLAGNLVDNAVRHNVQGGDIQVTTTTSSAGAVLSVASSGPVIEAADVDLLFQPFRRLGQRPARRDGHGLGLSIVRAIATAHDATITAQPRSGGGLAIEVTFPPSTQQPQTKRAPRQ